MVNRQKRDIAAQLLEDFLSGRTSNDNLEDDFPNDKEDPALAGIYERLWFFWESRRPRTFLRSEEGSTTADDLFQRCIFFSDLILNISGRPGDLIVPVFCWRCFDFWD